MREILFRGKRVENDEWVDGYYCAFNGVSHRIYTGYAETDCGEFYPDYYEVIPKTVRQYTGLTDKNGTKIFEGDIATCMTKYGGDIGIVTFKDGKFMICWQSEYRYPKNGKITDYYYVNARTKVIGNIYDNPELIGDTNNG